MQTFPRSARMLRKDEFTLALRKRGRIRTSCFECAFVPQEDAAKLGLIVSRRVGNAVRRNAVKRRVREWFRAQRDELPGGLWLVRALPASGRAGSQDLFAELTRMQKLVKRRACSSPSFACIKK